jgi:CO/xanthine dehydrogenase Mo-binding subunit
MADEIVEMSYKTARAPGLHRAAVHCSPATTADGQAEMWSSSQGHFVMRTFTAKLLGMRVADLRVHAAEIGGGFGGKTMVYVEPIAVLLSKKAGHPVKLMMTREEVFKATGPTSGASMTIKIGASPRTARSSPPKASTSTRPAPSPARPS